MLAWLTLFLSSTLFPIGDSLISNPALSKESLEEENKDEELTENLELSPEADISGLFPITEALISYDLLLPTELCAKSALEIESDLCSKDPDFQEKSKNQVVIKSVILIPDVQFLEENPDCNGVCYPHLIIPGHKEYLAETIKNLIIDQPFSKERLLDVENAIFEYYKMNRRPLVAIFAPEQKITNGILHIVIKETRLDGICFRGNYWFSDQLLREYVTLKEDQAIDSGALLQDLIWMNRNPFRETAAVLEPGSLQGTTQISFVTKERRPYRLLFGVDNTGFETTGETRLIAGIDIGNLFNTDQILSYQYLVGTDWGRFYAHTARYQIPLPWRNILEFFGGYSGIRAIMPIDGVHSQGHSWQASTRYTIPLRPRPTYTHEFTVGYDYKETNINLILEAVPILGDEAVISQLIATYKSSLETPNSKTSFEIQWVLSPGDILPHQSKATYSSLRPSATSTYTYFRGKALPIFKLPSDFEFLFKFMFQYANENLLSSEQFGLGGYDTVRGYDERILNTDNGALLSSEFRSPAMRIFTNRRKDLYEVFQLLAFLDFGMGMNHSTFSNIWRSFGYLAGIGGGMRYYFGPYINVRLDIGFPLHKRIQSNIIQEGIYKINFSTIFSF